QGCRAAAQVHLRPRQDPRPSGHRCLRPGAAQDRQGREERPRDRPAALLELRSLSEEGTVMTTKLILTNEVTGLGAAGDVVDVKDGYARNYLLPRGLATAWTKGGPRQLDQIRAARSKRAIATLEEVQSLEAPLEATPLGIPDPAGENGRLFGAVASKENAEGDKGRLVHGIS